MLFIYTLRRYPLFVGVISTLLLSEVIVHYGHCMPLSPLKVTSSQLEKASEDGRQRLKHTVNFNRSDYYQTLFFRFAALFVGIFLIFLLLMCLCSMCWCASWTIQWPITGFSWRNDRSQTKTRTKRYKDLPPSYELVLAYKEDELANTADEDPPSYTEALLNLNSCNGAL